MTTLLVASAGGHLKQLVQLAPRIEGVGDDPLWVSWDSPQTRSLLHGRRTVFVRPTPPRSPIAVARNLDHAVRLWRFSGAHQLVSTGSQLVLPFAVVGRLSGKPCHFIESAARASDHSLTARMLSRIPGMRLYTQYPSAADDTWRYIGSVFDGFSAARRGETPAIRSAVVTLGTMPRWGFLRLVEAARRVLPPDAEVLWQTGSTDVSGLALTAHESLPAPVLERAVRDADVVISHAGVGSALVALEAGRCPVLVPRDAGRGEHVDDHQLQIADELARRGLAVVRSPEQLELADLQQAAATSITISSERTALLLCGT
jgi:UDP-N-acetylglucosamine transferase subunit ALG13